MFSNKNIIEAFFAVCLLSSCTFSTGTKVESHLGIPQLFIPDNWSVSTQNSSDSTFALSSRSLDTENKKFNENIDIYKEQHQTGLFGPVLTLYTEELKRKYYEIKFETVDDYETAKSSGVLIGYTFKVNQYDLFTAAYICNMAGNKNPFIMTYTCLNEPNESHSRKLKFFQQFLSKSF
jgi:hypothetical protein